MAFVHKSVLFHETIDALNIRPDGIYVDCRRRRAFGSYFGTFDNRDFNFN